MELVQYRELAAFSQFASDLMTNEESVKPWCAYVRTSQAGQNNPMPVEEQVAIMWFGVKGY